MSDTESDLPNAFSDEVPLPGEDAEHAEDSRHTGSGWFIPLSTLWWHLPMVAIVAVLEFVLLALALIWDQWPWLAIITLPIGIGAAIYTTWRVMMLQRFYAEITPMPKRIAASSRLT